MIFRKGKSDNLKFKNSGELSDVALATAPDDTAVIQKPKDIRQKIKIKKVLVGSATHYFPKSEVGQFLIENIELSIGDKILISGPTTGNQEMQITAMFVNGQAGTVAKTGDKMTMSLPFRIRLSDKIYKILN